MKSIEETGQAAAVDNGKLELELYAGSILILKSKGFTVSEIVDWMCERDVSCNKGAIKKVLRLSAEAVFLSSRQQQNR